ncbi:phosphatidylinositol phosphatase PTPRQ-like isoform X2 [Halichondria panicea]|uniref:phosphatidylinositol phosphatase PTPRQ-like isoform X2 n=1 Tax=Halichondria panicea TaxID=6063 RepID=UPI00312B4AAF
MTTAWNRAQKVMVLVALLSLSHYDLSDANNQTAYQEGSGSGNDQPEAVTNLNILYSETENTIQVTWDDLLNINDTDLGYRIDYSFSALDTVVGMGTVVLSNVLTNSTSFEYDILAAQFSEDGVIVNVTVQACNSFSLGETTSINLDFMGVFAPLPVNFTVEVSSTQPAITLYWDNPFDSLPPDQLILTTVATKLSGTPLTENTETLTLTLADLTSGIGFDSSYTLSNLQFYSNYSISLAAVYSGETSTAIVREATTIQGAPSPTVNITAASITSTTAIITWEEPATPNGIITGYSLTLTNSTGSLDRSTVSNDTMFEVVGLSPFTEYTVSVQGMTEGGTGESGQGLTFTTLQDTPTSVQELTLNVSATEITVSWMVPMMPNGVIIGYNVTLSGINLVNNEVIEISGSSVVINETSYTVNHTSIPYSNYTAVVFASTNVGPGPITTVTEQTPEEAPSAVQGLMPEFNIVVPTSYNATSGLYEGMLNISWSEPLTPNGVITGYTYTVKGPTPDTDTVYSANITDTDVTVDASLLPASNYTVTVTASTTAGPGDSLMATVIVPEATPSAVIGLALNVTGSQLIVNWHTPSTPNGVIIGYNVVLSGVNLANNGAITITPNSATINETSYTVDHTSIPYSDYTAVVFASTNVGPGPMTTVIVQTPEEAPTPVQELELVINDTHLIVSWMAPMMPNGVIIGYNVTLSGINLANSTEIGIDPSSAIVTDTNYTVAHTSIPYSDYTAVVFASTIAGDSTNETSTIQTPEEAPTPVQRLALVVNDTHLIVTWIAPMSPNGVIIGYNVTLSGINLVNSMEIGIDPNSVIVTDTSYTVAHTSIPYSDYTAVVFASTSAGDSTEETVTEQTLEEAPSAVQDLMSMFNIVVPTSYNATSGLYEGMLSISWSEPLTPNGVITGYSYTVKGPTPKTDIIVSMTTNSTSIMVDASLLPAREYTVTVTAYTTPGPGDSSMVTITVPEAIPSPVTNLMLVMTNSSSLTVTWDPPSMPNGDLTYTATLSYTDLATGTIKTVLTMQTTENDRSVMYNSEPMTFLEPYARYDVVVIASTSVGNSTVTMDSITTPQGESEAPRNITIIATTNTTVIVSWEAPFDPNGVIFAYRITVRDSSMMVVSSQNESNTTFTSTFDNLIPFSTYTVTVRPLTGDNGEIVGEPAMTTFMTDTGVPTTPENLNVLVSSSTSLNVTWDPPSSLNAPTVSYIVRYRNASNAILVPGLVETELFIGGLEPFMEYSVSVQACSTEGCSDFTLEVVRVTGEAVPSPVTNLMLMMTDSSLTVTWDPPSMPNGDLTYTATFSYTDLATGINDTVLTMQTTEEDDRSVTYTSAPLEPYARYDVVVIASTSVGNSDPATASVFTAQGVSEAPRNLMTIPTNTTVVVTWEAPSDPNGVIFAYSVTLQDSDMTVDDSQNESNTTFISTFDNLIPFSNYTVIVTALTGDNGGIVGEPAMDTFMTDTGTPSAPTLTLPNATSPTTIQVEWAEPSVSNGIITTYLVTYIVTDADESTIQTITTNDIITSLELTNLTVFTNYSVFVRAATTLVGPPSETVTVVTQEDVPGSPLNLMALELSSTSINVSWTAPSQRNGILLSYTVYYAIDNLDASNGEEQMLAVDVLEDMEMQFVVLENLTEFTSYRVEVSASTVAGEGGRSSGVPVTTDPDSASPPRFVNVMIISSTAIEVSFSYPSIPRGQISGYLIEYGISETDLLLHFGSNLTVLNHTLDTLNDMSNQSVTIDSLLPFTHYVFRVAAYSFSDTPFRIHTGVFSLDTVAVRTDEDLPTAPLNFAMEPTSDSSQLTASWQQPTPSNGVITGYTVYCTIVSTMDESPSEDNFAVFALLTSANLGVMINDLQPFTYYQCFVSANTNVGKGPGSNRNTTRTIQDAPDAPPQNLALTPLTSTSVNVTWEAPPIENQRGILTIYTISYQMEGITTSAISMTVEASVLFLELTGLEKFTMYSVNVSASTMIGSGPVAVETVKTLSDTPSMPLNLGYSNDTSTSVNLTWDMPTSPNGVIESYTLQIDDVSTISTPVSVPNVTNINGSLTVYTLTGLLPFHTYELVLYALTDRGAGPGSTPLTVYTLEDLPTSPLNFTLSVVTSTQLMASWSPPNPVRGHITAYTVYCNSSAQQAYPEISNSAVLASITVDGDSTMMSIPELTPFTSYDCHVTASTSVGEGPPSNTDTAITAEAAPSNAPQNFQADIINSIQVTLSWSRPPTPNGVITRYTVTYSNETSTDISMMVDYTEMVTGYIVDGLNEFTVYVFRVTATTAAGTGPEAVLNLTTAQDIPSAPPQMLNAAFIDSTALSVNWLPPPEQDQNGEILNYQLTYQVNGTTDAIETMITVSGLNTTIEGLEIFTLYLVSVRPQTVVGLGPTAVVVVRTDSTRPGPPLSVAAPEVTPTSIFVTWEPPSPVRGDIISYSVGYTSSVHTGNMENITVTSVNITGLMEAVLYTITVYAHTDKGRGNGATVVQMTDEHFPDEPTMFLAEVLDSNAIRLTWNEPSDPNGVVLSYHLDASVSTQDSYITETGLEDLDSTLGNGDLREFVLTGLHPYVQYVFRLSAATSIGQGNATLPREPMTPEAAPAQSVSNIIAIADSSTSVNLTWIPPPRTFWNGPITSYIIDYTPVNNCSNEQVAINYTSNGSRTLTELMNPADPRNATSLVDELLLVTDLEEFISYRFTVAITTSAGSMPSIDSGCIRTNPTAPAVAPEVAPLTVTSNTSATLKWEELPIIQRNGIISHYIIKLSNDRDNSTQLYNTTNLSLNLTGLVPFTVYSAVVSAVNQEGEGPPSQPPVSAITLQGVPEAPTGLTLTDPSPTSLTVNWNQPSEFFGVPSLYYITYNGEKAGSTNKITVNVSSTSTSITLSQLVGDNTYTVSVEASTEGAGRGPLITRTADLPAGASPVVVVTPETVAIVPVAATDALGRPMVASPSSIPISFEILPEQQVNGPVDEVLIFVQRQPSNNRAIGTYYDNTLLTSDWSRYPSVKIIPPSSGGRKKRAEGGIPISVDIGGVDDCGPEDEVCNGPLVPGTDYSVGYRLIAGGQSTDYEFPTNATFSTAEAETSPVAIIAAIIVVVLVIIIVIVVIILIVVCVRRNRRGKFEIVTSHKNGGAQKLIPRDNGHGVPALGPSETNIVPLSETLSAGSTPTKFPTLPRANSRKIHIKEFKAYLTDMLDDSGYKFSEEYERVTEVGLDHAKEASLMADNRAKNRYTNILAYDHSRVKLSFVDDEPGSDYINACYIPGYRMRRAYLATQGPLPATFDDFWRMVWEHNTHIIVMLTQLVERGRTKCHRYWPGTDPSVYGDIAVELISEHEKEDWTVREFKLSSVDRKTRLVRHFQFTSWPDHGVPDTPIAAIDFVKTVRNYVAPNHGAFVVHCSAGVGRTGCFVALDTLLQQMKDHDWLDILSLACEMRQHRNHMIQTEAQYVFIHKAIQEVLEAEAGMNGGGLSQNGFSQSGNYPIYVNQFADDQNTQMTDYYAEDFLSDETHM